MNYRSLVEIKVVVIVCKVYDMMLLGILCILNILIYIKYLIFRLCENIPEWKACLSILDLAVKPCHDIFYVYGIDSDAYLDENTKFYCNVDGKNFVGKCLAIIL